MRRFMAGRTRRDFLAIGGTGLALGLLPFAAGCHIINPKPPQAGPGPAVTGQTPSAEQLVNYLNYNARKVQGVQCNDVSIDCKQGNQGIGLEGLMACRKPREFRLTAKVVGQSAVDIGSNQSEFWYWISKNDPPYRFHCSYDHLARGGVRMPFPFQPDMLIAALGIAEYDPAKTYEVKTTDRTFELVEQTVSPQGQQVKKVTVFNRVKVDAPAAGRTGPPQVVAYKLLDAQNRDICTATVLEVQSVRAGGDPNPAVLPYHVKLAWPEQKIEMTMWLRNMEAREFTPDQAERLFTRRTQNGVQDFDLARWALDGQGLGQVQSFDR